MNWLLLAIVSLIAASFLGVLRKILINSKSNTLDAVIIFQVFSALFISLLVILNGFTMPNISTYPINYLITAVFWGSAMILLFNAYKYLEASEIAVLSTIEIVIVVILGKIILNESLTPSMYLGVVLVIISIIILSTKKLKSFKFNRGFIYVSVAAILAASAGINDVYLLKNTDTLMYIFLAFLLPGIFVYLIKIFKQKSFKFSLQNINIKIILLLSLAAVLSNLPFYYAIINEGQISQVLPIYKTSLIFTIFLTAIILKERENLPKKFISALLAVAGIILISY